MAQELLPAGSTLVSTLLPGSPRSAEMSLGAADTSVRATSAPPLLSIDEGKAAVKQAGSRGHKPVTAKKVK